MSGEIVTFDDLEVKNSVDGVMDAMKLDRNKKNPDEMKSDLLIKRKKETPIHTRDLLNSGCTLLNLQCTGKLGCYPKGVFIHVVGDSDSGKTFLAMTAFGEASIDKNFDEYRFLYYSGEPGGQMLDRAGCFGKKAAERVEQIDVSSPEEFYDDLDSKHKDGKPYIAVLDSMDSLMPTDDLEKFDENKELRSKGKEAKGSFGVAKPKTNSALLRVAVNRLPENGSILIIISQTRDNIGFGSQFNPKVYSGGHALKFYAALQIWVSSKGDIKKHVKGKDRQLGIYSKLHIKKNHITGAKGAIDCPIYHCPGMLDDVGSMIQFLVEENHWEEVKGKIKAPEFEFEGNEEKLAQKIDSEGYYKDLQEIVCEVWQNIQQACTLQRKNRYS